MRQQVQHSNHDASSGRLPRVGACPSNVSDETMGSAGSNAMREIRRAIRQDTKLEKRIARLTASGKLSKAKYLSRKREGTISLLIRAEYEANKKLPLHRRVSPADVLRIARSVNLRVPSLEKVIVNATPKRNGALRPVMSFRTENKLRQRAVTNLLRPQSVFHAGQTALPQRGTKFAVRRLRAALEVGCKFVVVADIKDFYPSIDANSLHKSLPLSKEVTNANIIPKRSTLSSGHVINAKDFVDHNNNHTHYPKINIKGSRLSLTFGQTSQRGIPQGSSCSPIVAEYLMKDFVSSFPEDSVTTFADDIVLFARTKKEATSYCSALRAAIEQHSAGSLSLKTATIRRTSDGFEFLGYDFCTRKGRELVRPSRQNMRRIEAYLKWALTSIALGDDTAQAKSRLKSWAAAFSEWPGHKCWLQEKLTRIEAARQSWLTLSRSGASEPERKLQLAIILRAQLGYLARHSMFLGFR